MLLIDTDVWIWHLRGNMTAQAALRSAHLPVISSVTWMELMQGARSRDEQNAISQLFEQLGVSTLSVTPSITKRAMALVESLALSHGMGVCDALIAGTALEANVDLLTGNRKHFQPVDGLQVRVFNPREPLP